MGLLEAREREMEAQSPWAAFQQSVFNERRWVSVLSHFTDKEMGHSWCLWCCFPQPPAPSLCVL